MSEVERDYLRREAVRLESMQRGAEEVAASYREEGRKTKAEIADGEAGRYGRDYLAVVRLMGRLAGDEAESGRR